MDEVRIAIVDDEKACIDRTTELLSAFLEERRCPFRLETFENVHSFLAHFTCQYDLVFLDILMPYENGIELARQIREKDKEVLIVFITSSTEYAISGYSVQAYDYLVKPLSEAEFRLKMQRIFFHLEQRLHGRGTITIKTDEGMVRLEYGKIVYLESKRHTTLFHTADGVFSKYSSLKNIVGQLPEDSFIQFNSGFVANLFFVERFTGDAIVLALPDGKKITLPVSRARRKETAEKIMAYTEKVVH